MQVVPMSVIRSFSFYIFILSQSTLRSEWPLSLIFSIYYSKPRKLSHFFVLYIVNCKNYQYKHTRKPQRQILQNICQLRAMLKTGYCLLNTFVSLSK